jgi:hypothetical protein
MGPFEEHLRDAIRINRERLPLYSKMSEGSSLSVSRALVLSETLSIPFAKIPDLWSLPFRKRGIPIVELEFISMEKTPGFSNQILKVNAGHFLPRSGSLLALKLFSVFITKGFSGACDSIKKEIHSLENEPDYHPMLRHVLESMLRISTLAPVHRRKAKEKGLFFSPLPLSIHLYLSHLSALPFSTWLDRKAAPLHARGIPIIRNDVPPIPENDPGYF